MIDPVCSPLGMRGLLVVPLLFSVVVACGAGGSAVGPTPGVELLDSIVLVESEETYLARPGGLAVDDDGDFYVVDYFANHFVRFDRLGAPVRVYGGPGEFGSIGEGIFVVDSVVGALDYDPRSFHLFDRRSGAFIDTHRIVGTPSVVSVDGERVWVGNIDIDRGFGVVVWDLDQDGLESKATEGDPFRSTFAALPSEYHESPMLRGTWTMVHTEAWGDTVVVGFAGSPFLLEYARDGTVRDTIYLPARHRTGVPPDFGDRLERGRESFSEKFTMASGLFGLSRTRNGNLVAIHFDSELHSGNRITSRVFASILSPDRSRACVDREVPTSTASQPVVTLRGDTLFVLEQHLPESGAGEAVTTLKSYRIDDSTCEWLSTRSPELAYRG